MRYELLGNLRIVDGPDISSIGAQKVEILLKKTEQAEPVPFEPDEDDET